MQANMGMIKILDPDQNPRVSVLTAGCDPLLQEFNDVFEGLNYYSNEKNTPLS
jgi:hypothetical protein